MRKLILATLFLCTYLAADIQAPEVLTDNDFETSEYQLFVTNTKNIPIAKEMTSKLIFEGDIKKYYKHHHKMVEKKFDVAEEVSTRLAANSRDLAYASYYRDIKSLQNIGITAIGSIALNQILGSILGDKTYVQVIDYYQDNEPQTRIIKYIVSDDGLDKDERAIIYNTTNSESYHFRSGGFQSTTYK